MALVIHNGGFGGGEAFLMVASVEDDLIEFSYLLLI
jgi:hypothetical protein